MAQPNEVPSRQPPSSVLAFPIPHTDAGLVTALRANHWGAKRALCERYEGELLKVATRILGSVPEVEPIVRATLQQALLRLNELTDPRSLRGWLLFQLIARVRRRVWRNLWRRLLDHHRNPKSPIDAVSADPQSLTYRLLDHLDCDNRLLFCLAHIHGMALSKIAAVLGIPYVQISAKVTAAHSRFDRLVLARVPSLKLAYDSYASLGAAIAKEQDRTLLGNAIAEFDLLESAGPALWRTRSRSRRSTLLFSLATFTAAFGLALSALLLHFQPVKFQIGGNGGLPKEPPRLGAWIVANPGKPKLVSFGDGTTLTLAPGARMRLLHTDHRGSESSLESGTTRLSVLETGRREHQVVAGPFVLQVPKGRADISWDAEHELLTVTAQQGYAVISGCQFGTGNSVDAGMTVETRCRGR